MLTANKISATYWHLSHDDCYSSDKTGAIFSHFFRLPHTPEESILLFELELKAGPLVPKAANLTARPWLLCSSMQAHNNFKI